jgi:NADP-dependent 3-hydroxy acid dehydrogenase YdfG
MRRATPSPNGEADVVTTALEWAGDHAVSVGAHPARLFVAGGGPAATAEPRRVADLVNVSSVAGRRVGAGGGIYQLTKHGVGVFSEALRQEITGRYVRSSLIEPGATERELVTHVREEIRAQLTAGAEQRLNAEDVANALLYIVTRPRHVAINEILVRPTEQVR